MPAKKPKIPVDTWVQTYLSPKGSQIVAAAQLFLDMVHEMGAHTEVSPMHDIVSTKWETDDGKGTQPLGLKNVGGVVVRFGNLKRRPALVDANKRWEMVKLFEDVVDGYDQPTHDKSDVGFPAFPVVRLNDKNVYANFQAAAEKLVALAKKSG